MSKPKTITASPSAETASPITGNPHTWLKLNPDESHATENFVFGVLEREYHGRANSAL